LSRSRLLRDAQKTQCIVTPANLLASDTRGRGQETRAPFSLARPLLIGSTPSDKRDKGCVTKQRSQRSASGGLIPPGGSGAVRDRSVYVRTVDPRSTWRRTSLRPGRLAFARSLAEPSTTGVRARSASAR